MIKLNDYYNDHCLILRASSIDSIKLHVWSEFGNKGSYTIVGCGALSYRVTNTPEEVYEMIKNAGN